MRLSVRTSHGALIVALTCALASMPAAQTRGTMRQVAVTAPAAGDTATELRAWDARIAGLLRDGGLRVTRVDADTMIEGREHERLTQTYKGVRVFGGDLVRQLDRGITVSVFGALYEGVSVDTVPGLTVEAAAAAFAKASGVTLSATNQPELVILPTDEGAYVLTYRVRAMVGADVRVSFLDATTGREVFSYSDLQTTVGTGTGVHGDTKKISTTDRSPVFRAWDQMRPATVYTFDMQGDLPRTIRFLNNQISLGENDMAADSDNIWTDAATVDGHVYAGWTYDYLYKRFGRRGLNDNNLRMASLVHPVKRDDVLTQPKDVVNTFYLNAFYYGNGIMVYGEGLPSNLTAGGYRWNYFAGALDVVAHELAHGVTDYSSALIYRNESGALNEAFSDIMGVGAEFYFQEVGAGYMKADYLIGEDLTTPIGGFRSMANPQAYGDPDHYSKRYLGPSDNGGVHSNSGIANHAFYLAVEGGTNRTSGMAVTGVGASNREQVEKVFYRAFTQLMTASATFSQARAATIQAARDLYGNASNVERAVTSAWSACGVE